MKSSILNGRQWIGLQKVGDAFLPGDKEYPSFSQLGCAEKVDSILPYLPPQDCRDLKTLLGLLSYLPLFSLRVLLWKLELFQSFPGPVGALIRLLRVGLKGLVVSLYYSGYKGLNYSGKTPLELMEYSVSVYTDGVE